MGRCALEGSEGWSRVGNGVEGGRKEGREGGRE